MPRTIELTAPIGVDGLTVVERPIPIPDADHVVVHMRAAGLNRSEWLYINGDYVIDTPSPTLVGTEGAGTVAAVGDGVDDIIAGDPVCVLPAFLPDQYGVLAEYALVPRTAIAPKPAHLDFTEAAAVWMAYATAYSALILKGRLSDDGATVVVSAASSSVGLAALHIARRSSATVIAVTRTADKRQRLLDAGADHVVVTSDDDLVSRVFEITAGRGFDLAIDAVSGDLLHQLASCAATGATIVEYGLLSETEPELPFVDVVMKSLTITGFHVTLFLLQDLTRRADLAEISRRIETEGYRPVIDRVFGVDDIAEAYTHLAGNRQFGKIVVTI